MPLKTYTPPSLRVILPYQRPTDWNAPLTEDELLQASLYRRLCSDSPEFREFVDELGLVPSIWELEYDAIVLDCNYMSEMALIHSHQRESELFTLKLDNPQLFRQHLPFVDYFQYSI